MMKVWITKYALTRGIYQLEAECSMFSNDTIVEITESHRAGMHFHREGVQWHRTREAAVKRAEKMRASKIARLEKQLAKLRKLEF